MRCTHVRVIALCGPVHVHGSTDSYKSASKQNPVDVDSSSNDKLGNRNTQEFPPIFTTARLISCFTISCFYVVVPIESFN